MWGQHEQILQSNLASNLPITDMQVSGVGMDGKVNVLKGTELLTVQIGPHRQHFFLVTPYHVICWEEISSAS